MLAVCVWPSNIIWVEHTLSPAQDGILAGIIRMVLGGNLKNSRHRLSVAVNAVPHHFSNILIDENDVNIISLDKTFEAFLNFTYAGISVHNHEIRLTILVDLPDTS